jgi:hypothetical protein
VIWTALTFSVCSIGLLVSALFIWFGVELVVTLNDFGGWRTGAFLLVVFVPIAFVSARGMWRRSKLWGP